MRIRQQLHSHARSEHSLVGAVPVSMNWFDVTETTPIRMRSSTRTSSSILKLSACEPTQTLFFLSLRNAVGAACVTQARAHTRMDPYTVGRECCAHTSSERLTGRVRVCVCMCERRRVHTWRNHSQCEFRVYMHTDVCIVSHARTFAFYSISPARSLSSHNRLRAFSHSYTFCVLLRFVQTMWVINIFFFVHFKINTTKEPKLRMNRVGNAATEPIFTNRLHVRRPVLSLSQRALSSTRTQIVVIDSREDIVPI